MNIDALSIGITGTQEEQAFIQFVKDHNLNWQLGQILRIPKIFHSTYFAFVGKDPNPNSPYVYIQKCLLRSKRYERRYDKEEARIVVPYTDILNYGEFERKRKNRKNDK